MKNMIKADYPEIPAYEEYDETLRRSSDCVGILKDLIGVCQVKCVSFFYTSLRHCTG